MTTLAAPPLKTIPMSDELNPSVAQVARFDFAAQKLNLDDGMWKILRTPNRGDHRAIPIGMDNGSIEVFTGYRVQHSIARGPAKAACATRRCHAGRSSRPGQLDDLEVRCGQHPLRRRQGGVICDPKKLSMTELEKITRRYTAELFEFLGPEKDVPRLTWAPTSR